MFAGKNKAQRGNGIGGEGSWNETRVPRTILSRERQGLLYAAGFLEPVAPLWLPCGALLKEKKLSSPRLAPPRLALPRLAPPRPASPRNPHRAQISQF